MSAFFLFTQPKLCGPRHVVGSKQSEQQLKKVKRCAGAFSNHNTFPDRGSLDRRYPDGGSLDQGSQDWESSDQESLDRPRGELSLDHMTIKAYTVQRTSVQTKLVLCTKMPIYTMLFYYIKMPASSSP